MDEPLLTSREAAVRLGMSHRTFLRRVAEDRILEPAYTPAPGSAYLYRLSDVERYAAQQVAS